MKKICKNCKHWNCEITILCKHGMGKCSCADASVAGSMIMFGYMATNENDTCECFEAKEDKA